MNAGDTSDYQGEDASQYDRQAAEHGWHGHEILFGLMYEFVNPGETLLDIGMGTGLGSFLFHRARLQIFGFDNSKEMLKISESKNFIEELVQHDLRHVPYPYASNSFNHVISLAVLNFFADVAPVIEEVARIIKPQGIFGFSVEEQKSKQRAKYAFHISGGDNQEREETAINMYRHPDGPIREMLAASGFNVLKDCEFLADRYPEQGIDLYFKAYIAQKIECP